MIHSFTNETVGPDVCDTCGKSSSVHREFLGDGDWQQNPDGTYSPAVPLGIIGPRRTPEQRAIEAWDSWDYPKLGETPYSAFLAGYAAGVKATSWRERFLGLFR